MSAAQDYYDQVLAMGHTPDSALAHTREHYPDFIPGVAAPVAAPVVAPVSQQAVPAVQPVAQPAIAPALMVAPVIAAAPTVGAPVGAQAALPPMANGESTAKRLWISCTIASLKTNRSRFSAPHSRLCICWIIWIASRSSFNYQAALRRWRPVATRAAHAKFQNPNCTRPSRTSSASQAGVSFANTACAN